MKTLVKRKIDYTVLDVEGHEIEVTIGMDLENNRHLFPIIQVELGGTWIDPDRSSMRMTQSEYIHYLNSFGYDVYLMGQLEDDAKHLTGALLPINDAIIRNACTHKGSNGLCYVQGNLVAVHPEHIREDLRAELKHNVEEAVEKLRFQIPFP